MDNAILGEADKRAGKGRRLTSSADPEMAKKYFVSIRSAVLCLWM